MANPITCSPLSDCLLHGRTVRNAPGNQKGKGCRTQIQESLERRISADKLLRLEQLETERRTAYRALLAERDNLVRQLQIKTAIIEKLDEKTAARK